MVEDKLGDKTGDKRKTNPARRTQHPKEGRDFKKTRRTQQQTAWGDSIPAKADTLKTALRAPTVNCLGTNADADAGVAMNIDVDADAHVDVDVAVAVDVDVDVLKCRITPHTCWLGEMESGKKGPRKKHMQWRSILQNPNHLLVEISVFLLWVCFGVGHMAPVREIILENWMWHVERPSSSDTFLQKKIRSFSV